jgi:hypothetical protein
MKEVKIFLASDILHAVKPYNMGPLALLPIQSMVCCALLSPIKIHLPGWV